MSSFTIQWKMDDKDRVTLRRNRSKIVKVVKKWINEQVLRRTIGLWKYGRITDKIPTDWQKNFKRLPPDDKTVFEILPTMLRISMCWIYLTHLSKTAFSMWRPKMLSNNCKPGKKKMAPILEHGCVPFRPFRRLIDLIFRDVRMEPVLVSLFIGRKLKQKLSLIKQNEQIRGKKSSCDEI